MITLTMEINSILLVTFYFSFAFDDSSDFVSITCYSMYTSESGCFNQCQRIRHVELLVAISFKNAIIFSFTMSGHSSCGQCPAPSNGTR